MLKLTELVGFGGLGGFYISIDSNTANFNLAAELALLGWDGVSPAAATIDIAPGVIVSSTSTANPAFDGTLPASSFILMNIGSGAYVVGAGGVGGQGAPSGVCSCSAGLPGGNGGLALKATVTTFINNQGTIGGGGGGGGGGGAECTYIWNVSAGGGGGGAGYGLGGPTNGCGVTAGRYGQTGATGTESLGGAGGLAGDGHTGSGGKGGDLGQTGTVGQTIDAAGGAGGAPGAAVNGNSFITWLATGTRIGVIS